MSKVFYPLMPAEKAMYLEQKLDPGSTSYNLNIGILIGGRSEEDIRNALRDILLSHEAFHSRYGNKDGVSCRIVTDEIPSIDTGAELSESAFRGLIASPTTPFDLEREIPVRIKLYPIEEGGYGLNILAHHIAYDGRSAVVFCKELESRLCGETVEASCDISDAAAGYAEKGDLDFYAKMFEGGEPVYELPVSYARPKEQPLADKTLTRIVEGSEYSCLIGKAKSCNITLFQFIFAAAAATLSKYCSCDDVVINVISDTRDEKSKDQIGMFVNTVPVRVQPKREMQVGEYLRITSETVRKAAKENNIPFAKLADSFCRDRNDMTINYMWVPETVQKDDLRIEYFYELQKLPKDIGFVIQRKKDSLKINLQYASELFDDEVMENLMEQFMEVIDLIGNNDAGTVRDILALPIRQQEELQALSVTAEEENTDVLLHRVFEKVADENKDSTALIACDRTLTYGELNSEANKVANCLIKKGVKRGESIVLLLPRRSFYFSVMFGVLKAGAAFIPCDPEYPSDRIRHILSDSEASFIITTEELIPQYDGVDCVDVKTLINGDANTDNPDVELTGDDLAYMIYTSGSTGKPKGVMLRHEGICNYLKPHHANVHYAILKNEVKAVLSVTTVSFDMSFKETCGALCNGKALVFADETQMNDPRALTELLIRTKADCFNATPSRFLQYLDYKPFGDALKGAALVMAGGESFPVLLKTRLKELGVKHIVNTYGPTEITVSSNGAELTDASSVSVGRPLLNVKEYIVDRWGELVPKGAVGELYIGGKGVAKGYKNLPEKTAESFVIYNGERFYRSGDLARWDKNGNVVILGRIDSQVKLRGLRIELGEIEELIALQNGIDRAACAVKKVNGQELLVAYYVAENDIDEDALDKELRKSLTGYMIPAAYVRVENIPINANGKTDRKALPVPEINIASADMTKPRNETEQIIMDIVKAKTSISEFGVNSHFSDLGVTSLSIVGLMLAVSERFNKDVSAADIRENDTVALLAEFCLKDSNLKTYELQSEYPLTQTQYGIYVECFQNPGTTIYNIPNYLLLDDSIDMVKLERAVRDVINAHPYIKLKLKETDNGIVAERRDDAEPEVSLTKSDHLPESKDLISPYDLLSDTLYRMELFDTPEGKGFYMEIHHIIGDGESRKILQKDIERAYNGETLTAEKFSGFEAALLEKDDRAGELYKKAKEYYDKSFADAEGATLPPVMAEKDQISPVGSIIYKTSIDMNALKEFCGRVKISPSTLFNAAYGYTLAKYAYSEEAVFTTIYNGRDDTRKNGIVSMLVKTLPVRFNIDSNLLIDKSLTELHEQLSNSQQYSIYSFGEISRAYGIKAETMLAFQGEGMSPFEDTMFCGHKTKVIRPELSAAKTALTVEVYTNGGEVTLRGEYRTDTFCREFIEGFLKCVERSATELSVKSKLGDIDLMYDGSMEPYEKENQTEVPVEIMSVNKLFENQVRLHPDKTAVIASGEKLTFDELNRLANRAAHKLIELGIHKDSIVGMVFDRTKEIFIAEHAILKAGGAFLPMVTEYPDDRISYCLDNAESPFVITTEKIKKERPELFADSHSYKTLTVEELTNGGNDENPDLDIPVDSLAYCIYTSGSTGNPKGVMIEHRNMCNYLNANERHPAIYWHTQDIEASLSVTSISFDMSITERFVSLCNGVTLCMASLDEIHNPVALAKLMNANHTESIVCTPSYLMSLLDEPDMREPIARLKAYHVGGEAFPGTLIQRLKDLNPNSHVMNGYGPTETSVCCTSSDVLPGQPITIGKPEANVTHLVMDKNMRLVPPGVCGELIIMGAGVGRGYVKLPDKTAASFFMYNGQRAYHSGDLVRLNVNGEYDYYGRLDNQVKLRGLRIELDEIETVITEYPGVKLSKVIVRNNGSEDYLAGFYTAEKEIPVSDMKAFLKTRLTPYMVPDAMLQLDTMPLTVNGKIDKKKLPDITAAVEEREYVEPVGEVETEICGFFSSVLKKDRIGATDNFFEIGGTSLSAAMVVSRAMRSGMDIVYKNIFDYPTPRQLADFIRKEKKAAEPAAVVTKSETKTICKYASVLEHNNPGNLHDLKTKMPANVFLAGATGFLGIHVLHELMHNDEVEHITCIIRSKNDRDPMKMLKTLLKYYFEDPYEELINNKVEIIKGDITDEDLSHYVEDREIDMVINCAAMVNHFETGNIILKVNYEGVLHLIDLALKKNARLIQISTLSISGAYEDVNAVQPVLHETDFDLGQITPTKYSTSKYKAEEAIYDAIANRGLKGKVIRIGNLMGRRADGEFQINFNTNGFMNRLKSYLVLGCFPIDMMDSPVEFSPVDMTARAIILLAGTDDEFTVFHANNCHTIHFANVLEEFDRMGYHIEIVSEDVFNERLMTALGDDEKNVTVSSLLSYKSNSGEIRRPVGVDNSYTVKALYRLGFSWPVISEEYLQKSIEALTTLGFFDE